MGRSHRRSSRRIRSRSRVRPTPRSGTQSGKITRVNEKGFGFIVPADTDGKRDNNIFFHAKHCATPWEQMRAGDHVTYVETYDRSKGKIMADTVTLDAPGTPTRSRSRGDDAVSRKTDRARTSPSRTR